MKYWRGYLTAAIFAVFSWVLIQMSQRYDTLIDMIYPYVTRSVQTFLTAWTGSVDFLVWQLALVFLLVIVLAGLVLVFVLRGNVIQWLGWVLAGASVIFCANTIVYGLNYYAGPMEHDLRLEMVDYTQSELEEAARFYRDQADSLADKIARDENGDAVYPEFADLAALTGTGFRTLTIERSFSVFGGDYTPVKELGWADLYSSMGVSGVTCALTGEAAVNPQIPVYAQPFAMAREMARRLCVARDDDAEFAAFLGCSVNESLEYRYSAYFMAYRCCLDALNTVDADAAERISIAAGENLQRDLSAYDAFFSDRRDETAVRLSDTVSDAYVRVGEETGESTVVYSSLCDYLVNWYISEYTEPVEEEQKFDPYDETQVDLSGIVGTLNSEGDGE